MRFAAIHSGKVIILEQVGLVTLLTCPIDFLSSAVGSQHPLDDPFGADAKAYRTTRIFGRARVTSSPDVVNSYRSVSCRVQVDVAKDLSPSRIV